MASGIIHVAFLSRFSALTRMVQKFSKESEEERKLPFEQGQRQRETGTGGGRMDVPEWRCRQCVGGRSTGAAP